MTADEFNEKYKDYLSPGHYGLDICDEEVVTYLDGIFPILIACLDNFSYQQIKLKFGRACFYFSSEERFELRQIVADVVESKINNLVGEERIK